MDASVKPCEYIQSICKLFVFLYIPGVACEKDMEAPGCELQSPLKFYFTFRLAFNFSEQVTFSLVQKFQL